MRLLDVVRDCTLCAGILPLGPRPIVQFSRRSRILIAGQAPGRVTHDRGRPFDDASGNRLRDWLGVTPDTFYDEDLFAVVPMAFCYPGTGRGGDLAPPSTCADTWRRRIMSTLTNVRLTIVIGRYAMAWHLPGRAQTVTRLVSDSAQGEDGRFVLPHPSPRNNRWLRDNPWFESHIVPRLRHAVTAALKQADRQHGHRIADSIERLDQSPTYRGKSRP